MGYRVATFLIFIFRPACFICMFISMKSVSYAKLIRENIPSLRHPPYPPDLYRGHYLSGVFGIFSGVWAILAFIPSSAFGLDYHDNYDDAILYTWSLFSLLIDAITTIGLIEAAVLQAGYLPSPLGSCSGLHKLGPYPNGKLHWLDRLGAIQWVQSGHSMTRLEMCKEELLIWRVTIAMVVFSGLATLLGAIIVTTIRIRNPSVPIVPKFLPKLFRFPNRKL